MMKSIEAAVFGGGCFWCTEAIFQNLRGVVSVVPGYAGGTKPAPTYEEVSTGLTGHAEVIRVEFDPRQITFETLLEVFFALHDPTTKDRQGDDTGTQYRSIILYTTPAQRVMAETYIAELKKTLPVTTELVPLTKFYEAEEYHRNYYQNNFQKPYCQVVIIPKLIKLLQKFFFVHMLIWLFFLPHDKGEIKRG